MMMVMLIIVMTIIIIIIIMNIIRCRERRGEEGGDWEGQSEEEDEGYRINHAPVPRS